jgi:hypothetical protein
LGRGRDWGNILKYMYKFIEGFDILVDKKNLD